MKFCTFKVPINWWIGVDFVFSLLDFMKADSVRPQELLKLRKTFPCPSGERHKAHALRRVLTQGLEYLIGVHSIHVIPPIASSRLGNAIPRTIYT